MARIASLKVQSNLKNLSEIRSFIEDQAKKAGLSEEGTSRIKLSVDEAIANIILHGYGETGGEISVHVDQIEGKLVVSIVDSAPPFNPLLQEKQIDPNVPLDDRALGGMGIIFIRENTDAQEYMYSEAGENIFQLTIHDGVQSGK